MIHDTIITAQAGDPPRDTDPMAQAPSHEHLDASSAGRRARRHERHRLPGHPAARLTCSKNFSLFVTLKDISPGGCCILRKGQLGIDVGETIQIDLWRGDVDRKLTIPARVCWISNLPNLTRAGLHFLIVTPRLQRQLDVYLEQAISDFPSDRPQPAFPRSDVIAHWPRREPQVGSSPSPLRLRPSPLPTPLPPSFPLLERTPLERTPLAGSSAVVRRMRPAHRQTMARIAEETGLHIQTLYSWLRGLQLEGESIPEHPRDPDCWSATDKLTVLLETADLNDADKQAYCEHHGITPNQLARWLESTRQAQEKPQLILKAEEELTRMQVRDQREIRRLKRELRQREQGAAITQELLDVSRKLQLLWGKQIDG